jgi:FkbM family methyltransferase
MEDIKSKYKHVSIETCALGSKNGTININVHPDLVGSSIYLEDEESNVNGESREVEIKTINSLIEKYNLNESSNTLLKIDVQGAEIDVLKGAEDILENIDLVILETSFFNFFNNNILIADIINYMDSKGFIIYDIFDFINRPLDGALAQVDLAFVQKKSKFKEVQVFATKEQRSELNEALNIKKKSNSIINKNDKIFLDNLNNLILKINQLKTLNYNYIIYGNGNIGKIIQALAQDKIIGYVDISDASNHPNNLKNIKFDKIIISVLGREDEIIKYLVEDLQIHRDKIITLDL